MTSITLPEICRIKYPGQIEAGNIAFRKPDNDILFYWWKVPGIAQPLESDLMAGADLYQRTYELNKLKQEYSLVLQNHIDKKAQEKNYKDGFACASYISSTNAAWKQEATDFIAWRDACWEYALDIKAQVDAEEIQAPSLEEFIANAPTLTWS